jgi:DNA-binding NarL/FixJ family response regulator
MSSAPEIILVIDDHPLFRDALHSLLQTVRPMPTSSARETWTRLSR